MRTNVGFRQAQNVGILYSAGTLQKHDAALYLSAQLKKLGKEVMGLCYATASAQVANSTFPVITDGDIKLWGTITHPQAKTFIDTPFDYLYQLDLEEDPILNYLLAKSSAKCRVGYYTATRASLFEVMVTFNEKQNDNNMNALIEQMLHYTQLLRAEDNALQA